MTVYRLRSIATKGQSYFPIQYANVRGSFISYRVVTILVCFNCIHYVLRNSLFSFRVLTTFRTSRD